MNKGLLLLWAGVLASLALLLLVFFSLAPRLVSPGALAYFDRALPPLRRRPGGRGNEK